ncbi:hypothetical protein HMPREF0379_1726 [[Eubacterium] yurii subsp. margaretiae ATCC 43715]|nr:hypothetical protein HMPREF0379_1726 [[Eubacterium] yurii subsp. margaretiae ATCC 43715]
MKYLFFLLIAIGLPIFIISIKYIIRFTDSEVIYELPFSDEQGTFTIVHDGSYALWLSGKKFTKSPLGEFGLSVINKTTGENVQLSENFLRDGVNLFKRGRMMLYSFQAEEGEYLISFDREGSIRDKMSNFLANVIIRKPVDYSLFSIQVRTHVSSVILTLCILANIFASSMIVLGIILPMALK